MVSKSLTVFLPCFNDGSTIASMVAKADQVARVLTSDYEIIVVDDLSADHSREILEELSQRYDKLRLVFHSENRGYGGALKSGFAHATKDLVFYTDGDAQYDVSELAKLFALMTGEIDVVNGFKLKRSDPFYRILAGWFYQYAMKFAFGLKIRDVDCDFRLMKREVLNSISLKYDSGVICVEMIKKMQDAGFKFSEVGVHHYFRPSGRSQFFTLKQIFHVVVDLVRLWRDLVLFPRIAKLKSA